MFTLITDIYGDHYNPETLIAINTANAKVAVPQAVAVKLPANLREKAVVLDNNESGSQLNTGIEAIPMPGTTLLSLSATVILSLKAWFLNTRP
jgi:L-ascorbate metabolism protein UlaG (beta-lactamase superfamily)